MLARAPGSGDVAPAARTGFDALIDSLQARVFDAVMTDRALGVRDDDRRAAAEGAAHVFDQTNGVLGVDTGVEVDSRRGRMTQPPSTFGIPPLTSL